MHFWVSATRGRLQAGFCWPRKIGTNWFIPALVKSRLGESGSRLDEGTMVCCFDLKKSRNDWRIWRLVINQESGRNHRVLFLPDFSNNIAEQRQRRRAEVLAKSTACE